jgi:hypothetical protein
MELVPKDLILRCVLVPLLICTAVPILWGQADQGAITGTVKDSSGAVVPNANVSLTNEGTNLKLQATTDQAGVYTFEPVKVGRYTIEVSVPGFRGLTQSGLEVHVAQRVGLNLTLQPGSQQQIVTVAADAAPVLQTEDASTGQVFTTQQINDTPLNGRNWVFIAQLSAGVAASNGSRGQGNGDFVSNGTRATQNNFILDGVDNNSNSIDFLNGASYVVRPPPDALQEFKVQTADFSAEFGHSAGAVVNASIKSGTNEYHGNLWEYLRNDDLDATDLFASSKAKYRENQFGGTFGGRIIKDKLFFFVDTEANLIELGQTATFYTVPSALERQGNFSELLNTTLTGAAQPIKLYEPGTAGTAPMTCNGQLNVLCASQIDPVAAKLINLYPLPNRNNGLLYNNFVAQPTDSDNTNQFDVRVDYNLSAKDQMFARYSWSNENKSNPPPFGAGDGGNYASALNYGQNGAFSETHEFSATLINEFRTSYSWGHYNQFQANYNTNLGTSTGINLVPFQPENGGLPAIGISGYSELGSAWFLPTDEFTNVFEILDNVTKVIGNHTVKAGVNFQNIRYATLQPNTGRGALTYDGKYTGIPGVPFTGFGGADFLTNEMDSANLSSISPNQNRKWYDGAYVQDDWKVNSRLTLNLGLRYDYYQQPSEKHGNDALFYNTGPYVPGGGTGVYLLPDSQKNTPLSPQFTNLLAIDNIQLQYSSNPSLVDSQKTNFAPRFGLAYRLTDKLVVRTGFGIFFGGAENLGNFPNLAVNYPFDIESSYVSAGCGVTNGVPVCPTDGVTLENGFSSNVFATPQLRGTDLHAKTSYTEQYNFTLEYALPGNMTATAGYVGNASRHQPVVIFLNGPAALVGPGVNTIPYQPFPDFGSIGYISDTADGSYNSLQTSLAKRFSQGVSFLATYTWAHSLDDAREPLPSNGDGGNRNFELIGLQPDYTNSPFDVRQRFTFLGTYQLPFGKGRQHLNHGGFVDAVVGGWSITPAFQAQTGQPFTVDSDTGSVNGAAAFPYLVGNPYAGGGTPNATNPGITCPATVRNANNWYNPCAFANPPQASAIPVGQVITSYSAALGLLGSPREQLAGPGFYELNTSLFKNFVFTEARYLQFRTDIFNVTNTPSLGQPNGSLGSNGGQITTTRFLGNYTPNARFFQFALKLYF